MNYLDKIRTCERSELPELAREITDDEAFPRIIVDLARGESMDDYMRLAEILTFAEIDGTHDGNIYGNGMSASRRYVEKFLSCCKLCGYPESEYIGVFISAISAPIGSALYGWKTIAEEYLAKRAKDDFDLVATYIDRFDKKYTCYSILLGVDRARALGMLLGKVLYERFIDKSAVRSILMTCPDLTDALISAYDGMNAKERAAIVKLLLPHKDDPIVEEFLNGRAANDKSKTVIKELTRSTERKANKSGGAVKYFESLMSTGETVEYGKLCELIGICEKPNGGKGEKGANTGNTEKTGKNKYGEVAENIFFCTVDKNDFDALKVICYDGKKFFDLNGRKVKLEQYDRIGVLHPLDLERDDPLFNLDIDQPFPQLRRPIFEPLAGERLFSKRFFGTFLSGGEFAARFKQLGFEQCGGTDGKFECALRISGGYAVGAEYDGRTFMCEKVYYYRASDIVRQGRRLFLPQTPMDISELDGKTYSELTYYVARLFDAV